MNKLIAWFTENHVVANLLMLTIIAAGLLTIPRITKEVFPEFSLDMVYVSVRYLGAAPQEVEEGVCIKIEEAIQDLEGIKRMTSSAGEGVGNVTVELEPGSNLRDMLNDIKARVDAIETFPEQTEKPVISEITNRRQVIDIAVSGDVDEASLKSLAESARDELTAIPGITQVELFAARPYEISIEISEEALRRHKITFDYVANAIRRSSLDLPAGSIRTDAGEILLRTKGQAYRGREFEEIILFTRPDGTRLLLGDVANVVDGFADTDQSARFGSKPAVGLRIFRVGDQDPIDIADKVRAYVEEKQVRVPEGITITAWNDYSRLLRGRLDLMTRSARNGYILVFMILALFLRFRLAWWVSLGIPISFLGAFWLMPSLGTTINLLSLFAFIVVLGIVVDDAIIVGENIYKHHERGSHGIRASAIGTAEVAMPVVFGVLTTIAAFAPLLFVTGMMGKFMRVIPIIVILTLIFSLVESLLILPAHLASSGGTRSKSALSRYWQRIQDAFASRFDSFVERMYRPALRVALKYRYTTIAIAVTTLLLSAGLVGAGYLKFVFFPDVESDYVNADLTMPPGHSIENTAAAISILESSALVLQAELIEENPDKPSPIRYIFTAIGEQPRKLDQATPGADWNSFFGSNLGEVMLELAPSEERTVTSAEISRRWRELSGPIPDLVELTMTSTIFSPGDAINVQLTGLDVAQLETVAKRLKEHLPTYTGVYGVADNFRAGKQEVKLTVKPAAEAYGISLSDLARQVRQAFYGEEAQRIQRGRDDVRVMVRYPADQRRSIGDLENMRVRTSDGGEVPFPLVANATMGRGYSAIRRVDRKRAINVTADVDESVGNASQIVADLKENFLPGIMRDYPSVSYSFEGEQREQQETMAGLRRGFLFALLAIYALMAIPFKSYVQPLIVMSVIPFGFVGAVWGHVVMGLNLTVLSMFGVVALTGVVVNDSLVLVHFVNERRKAGDKLLEAVSESGVARFRPIILTSLTTFAGLTPLLIEKSVQAQFLVPMAVSLGFGVLFATSITLFIVPTIYVIMEDGRRIAARVIGLRRAGIVEEAVGSSVGGQSQSEFGS